MSIKKIVSILVAIMMMVSLVFLPGITANADDEREQEVILNSSDKMLGDINDDKRIDSLDSSAILKAYSNLSTNKASGLTEEQMACADVNSDGVVDAVDACIVLDYYAYITSASVVDDISFEEFIKSRY